MISFERWFDRIRQDIMPWLLLVIAAGLVPVAQGEAANHEFLEIAPGHYLRLGKHQALTLSTVGDIANTGFIIGTESVAVVDPGGSPAAGSAMLAAIREKTDLPVSHVILTHLHPDHIFGSSAFVGAQQVVAHKNYARALVQRGTFYRNQYQTMFADKNLAVSLQPNQPVEDELRIDLGGRSLIVRAHPTAHTDNDLSVFDSSSRILWASDLIFADRIPSLDGSLTGWLGVMEDLAVLQPDLVIPGHGLPGTWATVALPQKRYLTLLLQDTRRSIANNQRLSDAVESVALTEREHWRLFDDQHPGNVTRAYTELEWE